MERKGRHRGEDTMNCTAIRAEDGLSLIHIYNCRNHRPGHKRRVQMDELCKNRQRTADAFCRNHRAEQCRADDEVDQMCIRDRIIPGSIAPMIIFILPPGGFFVFGMLIACANRLAERRGKPKMCIRDS